MVSTPAILVLFLLADGSSGALLRGQANHALGPRVNAPPRSSCYAHFQAGESTDGIYPITLTDSTGATSTYSLFCDMNRGGWTLVGELYGKPSIHDDWLRTAHDVARLTSTAIEAGWASTPAVDLAVNGASQVRLSNADLSKYMYWDMDDSRTVDTWWNHAAGRSAIQAASDHSVTVRDQSGNQWNCWQNAYGIMKWSSHGGSYPMASLNTAGNTAGGDGCMAVGVQPSGSIHGFSQNNNGYDAGNDVEGGWPNSYYGNTPQLLVWLGGAAPPWATPSPTPATLAPTAMPTLVPTFAPTATSVSVVGDPHATNLLGRHYTVLRTGELALLRVPKWGLANGQYLLEVNASAERDGNVDPCGASYIKRIVVDGTWAKSKRVFAVQRQRANPHHKQHLLLGPGISLTVAYGVTDTGVPYLNFRAGNLRAARVRVGGLLGDDEDEYRWATEQPKSCRLE